MSKLLSPYLYADEAQVVRKLADGLHWPSEQSSRVRSKAQEYVRQVRAMERSSGELESFLQQYSLTTDEGLALMSLAEALLRIPDKKTANALIRDKITAANWLNQHSTGDWIVRATGIGLLMTRKTLDSALARIGEPVIREAMIQAMQILGKQFVLGETIEDAAQNGQKWNAKGYRISYDMLGEGARTAIDAENYFKSYLRAINYLGDRVNKSDERKPGISVKLSALHPRYVYAQKEISVPAIAEKLKILGERAAARGIPLTIDAEEVDRLELSLEIIDLVLKDNALRGWDGFGLAVQAYQKRALPLLDELAVRAKVAQRRLQVRLVKGAYWDAEIKRAQVQGLPEYPVFTRKVNTDLSYQACAAMMLSHRDLFYPMFATHNAQTAVAVIDMAREKSASFEMQRLHGMGEALYDVLLKNADIKASIYAPVGSHEDLLAYLVRRLLENGANSSFVNKLLDDKEPIEVLINDPVVAARNHDTMRHPKIPLPANIYGVRKNSAGLDLTDDVAIQPLLKTISKFKGGHEAAAVINGKMYKEAIAQDVSNPANRKVLGKVWSSNKGLIDKAFRTTQETFPTWSSTTAEHRASILEKIADLYEKHADDLMAFCVHEAGRTIPDALAEVREAVDFCRYYAQQGRKDFGLHVMQGPTGEKNTLQLQGRGTFVCISPWNFPLAIFTGQIVAALMAGNCVIAKPAEQTPLISAKAISLMHKAGIPAGALALLPGDGEIGARLVQHEKVAGVAFTGSTDAARSINKTLAGKSGAIVPLIAETGGQNAMIVDSSALPERVVDDVLISAFGSVGQRCSSLRVLYLQKEIADKVIRMLKGAMAELKIGDPALLSTDTGPVIDEEAHMNLMRHRRALDGFGKKIFEVDLDPNLKSTGHFFAPCAFEIPSLELLQKEVFGPILHVIRFDAAKIQDVIDDINNTGYGLTFGVQTRIDSFRDRLANETHAGNVYVNRSMIGAVVGVQPFGGQGLSGTGPKAGGPYYLPRFAHERVISIDTTAAGGNASLVSLSE